MEIREVLPDEHGALGELTVDAYADVHPADDLDDYATELRDVATRAAADLVLVAADGDELLGGVTYVAGPGSPSAEFGDADAAGIRMLAVAPGAQRRGVGGALTRACIDRARAAGRAQVVLHSTDAMTAAHRLYERLGFRRDPTMDQVVGDRLWLRGFRLRLDGAGSSGRGA
ncbi:MAG: GNAT family N-acetyltransferase [Acidimicrobiia bacterium]